MPLEIVTSWKRLFQLAHAEGQARKAHEAWPTPETAQRLNDAIAAHEDYRQMCLKADRMVDQPAIF